MKKQTYLSILSFSFIFLLTGCIPQISNIQNIQNQQPPVNSEEPVTEPEPISKPQPGLKDVVLRIDKLQYLKGETTEAMLSNYSNESIWYLDGSCERSWDVEKQVENNWATVFAPLFCPLYKAATHYEIKSGESIKFNWDSKIEVSDPSLVKKGMPPIIKVDAPTGKYRISFSYSYRTEQGYGEKKKIISEVFEIKDSIPSIDFYSCKNNSDCVKVKAQPCSCGASMNGQATAINKDYVDKWDEYLGKIDPNYGSLCPDIMSQHPSCSDKALPKCVDGKCKLQEGYFCPEEKSINCMPSVLPENAKYCSGPYHEWIKEHCNNVFFTE